MNSKMASIAIVPNVFAALLVLVLTPIGSGDTDLWYHLNGGRLLWEFGDLPDTAFFSFVESQAPWVNYFWGFQATTFLIHEVGGYEGLILLRVVLVGIAATAITGLVLRENDSPRQRTWALVLLVLTLTIVLGRISLIRPHLVSYMMIAVFLLILERHPRWLPALPVLTVLWGNLHGVEWLTGAEAARFALDSSVYSSPAMDGGTLYLGTMDGRFLALRIDAAVPEKVVIDEPFRA